MRKTRPESWSTHDHVHASSTAIELPLEHVIAEVRFSPTGATECQHWRDQCPDEPTATESKEYPCFIASRTHSISDRSGRALVLTRFPAPSIQSHRQPSRPFVNAHPFISFP